MSYVDDLRIIQRQRPQDDHESTSLTSLATSTKWPGALSDEAYHGVIGDLVRIIEPTSEADPAALLFQFLGMAGSMIGRGSFFRIESDRQHSNLFMVIVGQSSKARKGTSLGRVKQIMKEVDADFMSKNLVSGLSSGEGVIYRVRDARTEMVETENGQFKEKTVDPGIDDKRLLVIETELGSMLKVLGRDGNKLSAIIRDTFDHGDVSTLTKTDSLRATNAHVSIISHITAEEIGKSLGQVELFNGFANRFIFVAAKRSKKLPLGGAIDIESLRPLIFKLRESIEFARKAGELKFDEAAAADYGVLYDALDDGRTGLFATLTARAETHIVRLASIYALLDRSVTVGAEHLRAAVACWEYAEKSVRCVFGTSTGNKLADRILDELKLRPNGLTQTELLRDVFKGNVVKSDIGEALSILERSGRAHQQKEANGEGRPPIRWLLKKSGHETADERNEQNERYESTTEVSAFVS